MPKKSMVVGPKRSTSEKTAPNEVTPAGVGAPGMKKVASVTLLSSGVKMRRGLNVLNVAA